MNISRIFANVSITSFILCASMPIANSIPPLMYSTSATDWKLSVRSAKDTFSPGESIELVVTLTNRSKTPLTILKAHPLLDYRLNLRRDGVMVPVERQMLLKSVDAGARSRAIDSGKGVKDTINLSEIVENKAELAPGNYTVDIHRSFHDPNDLKPRDNKEDTNVVSAEIKFKILRQ